MSAHHHQVVLVLGANGFGHRCGFAGKNTFIYAKFQSRDQLRVSRHLISSIEQDQVTWNNLAAVDLYQYLVADDACLWSQHLSQSGQGGLGPPFLNKPKYAVQHDHQPDRDTVDTLSKGQCNGSRYNQEHD